MDQHFCEIIGRTKDACISNATSNHKNKKVVRAIGNANNIHQFFSIIAVSSNKKASPIHIK